MRSRTAVVALLCAGLASLAACGDSDTESAAPTSAASGNPAASAAAGGGATAEGSTAASAPAGGSADGSSAAGGRKVTDKGLCTTVRTAGSTLKDSITQAQRADGHVEAADAKKAFVTFRDTLNGALGFAEATKVTEATRAIADEVGKASEKPDPITAAADAGFDQLSSNLTTACKAVGVTVNF